jgi:hypothetical protein
MTKLLSRLAIIFTFISISLLFNGPVNASSIKGIYITQSTMENTQLINKIIANAKKVGIDTFVVDLELPGKLYAKNVALLKENDIRYVTRIEMFPGGGTHKQITDESYWKRKYKLIQTAIAYGAQEIQLDYIRYNTRSGSSPEHSKNIYKIVRWYKEQLASQNIPLQMDVFGISSYGEEPHIGQNIPMMSQTVDTLCPMVYPSHYTPFKEHMATPYETVYDSLTNIKHMFKKEMPIKLVAYIELSNYHYPLSHNKKMNYIRAQLKAVHDSKADGWYAWSAHNQYDTLFEVLGSDASTPAATAEKNDTHAIAEKNDVSANAEKNDAHATAEKNDVSANAEKNDAHATAENDDAPAIAEKTKELSSN